MLTNLYVRARTWAEGDEGATALEYGILVAVIALIILVGVGLFGNALNDFFAGLSTQAPL
jgi:pilus assembly protein Flp/PilA